MSELVWRTPILRLVYYSAAFYDAFSEPEEWEAQRVMLEQSMLQFHTGGLSADDADGLVEAMRHWVVGLLQMGHYPSRQMLGLIACSLEAAYWPGPKQAKRAEEAAWLISVQSAIDHLAATKYCDSNTSRSRTCAEEEVAKRLKLSVDGLRRKRTRFRAQLKQREAAVEQRRQAAVERRRQHWRIK
jgi:hypothetical protein